MDYSRYFAAVIKWSWLLAIATLLAAGVSYRSASRIPRLYESTTTLLVGRSLQTLNPNPADFQVSMQLANIYSQFALSQTVLQATVDALKLDEPWYVLASSVQSRPVNGGDTFVISVVRTNPKQAKTIADEIARQVILKSPTPKEGDPQREFANQQMQLLQSQIVKTQAQITDLQKRADQETSALALQDLRNQMDVLQQKVAGWQNTYAKLSDFYKGSNTNYVSVIQPGTYPTSSVGTKTLYDVALAGGLGFALALGGIILAEYLDDSVKSPRDLEGLGVPILGGIRGVKRTKQPSDLLFMVKSPQSPDAEACRFLCASICLPRGADRPMVVLVTSPGPLEGKTTIAANLAASIAESGRSVILIDANFHRPSVHQIFELTNREGLSSLLLDDGLSVESAVRGTRVPNLRALPSGPLVANPSSLLTSRGMAKRLDQVRRLTDVVVVDSAAVLGVADTSILAALSDEVVVVTRIGRTRRVTVQQSADSFARLGIKIRGLVLNGQGVGRTSYQRYYAVLGATEGSVGDQQCPHLGLASDRHSLVLGASVEHRCFVSGRAQKVSVEEQASLCLCPAHVGCRRMVEARGDANAVSGSEYRESVVRRS